MICPYCKETILDGAIKCRHCGSMLNTDRIYGMSTGSITTGEIQAFVGTNANYYLQKFSRFTITRTEKFCVTWNWSCFGFTFLWMLYRKMYVESLITFIVFCIPGLNILLHIFAGIVGNYLYYRQVKDKILEVRAIPSLNNYYAVLQDMGGVNQWVIAVGVIFSIILSLLIFSFFAVITAYMRHFVSLTI